MVDKQNAFKMVHFVLETRRLQIVHCLFMDFAVQILPTRTDFGRAFDFRILVGDRQAALAVNRMFFRRVENFGIYENARIRNRFAIFAGFLQIHYQETLRNANLDRRKADAGRCIHRLEHVIDERF